MEQTIVILDDRVEVIDEEQIVVLPADQLDQVGGGVVGLYF
jgi:hypothetical protein